MAHDFDKVAYLFGPTARQSRDQVSGEVAKGTLHFETAARVLAFTSSKGPGFRIPYDKIRKFESEDASMARAGSLAVGAGTGALFIRQHKHFVLIRYLDEKEHNRSALLQLDKGNYKDVLNAMEKETGIKIEK